MQFKFDLVPDASSARRALLAALVALPLGAAAAQATPQPSGVLTQSFGLLADATFGGAGIPNDAVAYKTVEIEPGVSLTWGLTAHQRYSNPPLTNDGAGTFFAQPGINLGGPGNPSSTPGALWNFAFFVGVSSGALADLGDLAIVLLYDTDPGAGVDYGVFDLSFLAGGATVQDSQNLAFAFLNPGFPFSLPFISPPDAEFDPDATGVYSFELFVGQQESVAIDVVVGEAPEPAALGLLGFGLLGLAAARRRRA